MREAARARVGALPRWRAAAATTTARAATSLTVYSGREEELVAPLFERFEEETGITVDVRYADSAELAATIAEEGDNSPADVFFAQDPGSLGAVDDQLAELPESRARPGRRAEFRDSGGRWVGTSGRARVIVFNTDELTADEVPDSVFDLTDPEWKGKVGLPPTNASFQAFVTAMRLDVGDERTQEWLEALKQNDPKFYERNTPVVEATASGEIQVGLVNHYYLYLVKEEQPDAPIENKYLPGRRPGRARQRRRRGRRSRARSMPTRPSGSSSSCSPTAAALLSPRTPRRRSIPLVRGDRPAGRRADARRSSPAGAGRRPLLVRPPSSKRRSSC